MSLKRGTPVELLSTDAQAARKNKFIEKNNSTKGILVESAQTLPQKDTTIFTKGLYELDFETKVLTVYDTDEKGELREEIYLSGRVSQVYTNL